MAIIEPTPPEAPLNQGDILAGLFLFTTRQAWAQTGGEAGKRATKLCLVLSRSCVAAHKEQVVVAAVEKYPETTPKGLDTFEKVLHFVTGMRDARVSPDLFYLGQLTGQAGRFCARLDSLHTIEVPEDAEVRAKFLVERRIGTLHPDFARELHLRVFSAFASLGFDDHRWFSSDDLQWLVAQGRSDIAGAERLVREQEALQAARSAEGRQFAETELTNARRRLEELRERVAPFEQELVRREGAQRSEST